MSDIKGFPLEWRRGSLVAKIWLEGPRNKVLCRLLVDTGASHIALPMVYIEDLGLEAYTGGEMMIPASGRVLPVKLFLLPSSEMGSFVRTNLLVAPIDLPPDAGYHGMLGMN